MMVMLFRRFGSGRLLRRIAFMIVMVVLRQGVDGLIKINVFFGQVTVWRMSSLGGCVPGMGAARIRSLMRAMV